MVLNLLKCFFCPIAVFGKAPQQKFPPGGFSAEAKETRDLRMQKMQLEMQGAPELRGIQLTAKFHLVIFGKALGLLSGAFLGFNILSLGPYLLKPFGVNFFFNKMFYRVLEGKS